MAACRAVIRLLEFSPPEVYLHTMSVAGSNPVRQSAPPYTKQKYNLTRPEVHVTTEHITMAEFPYVH